MYFKETKFCWILITILVILTSASYAQKYTIKFATLAPEGSTWMNIMRELDAELRAKTNGEVGFKIYAGGVMGDEVDVLRKIRISQLHAAGFTGLGMGQISPEIRIMDTPLLFHNYDEVDFILNKFGDYFEGAFAKNGYEVLGWAEVGFVYVFTKEPVSTLDEMRKIKMWVWQGDDVAEATFKAFGLNPIPLSVIDVMTALQTNMIDGVYSSPLAAVALQWFTRVSYMFETPLADAAGAVLISNKMINRIPEEYREILKTTAHKYMTQLTRLTRIDNEAALETLKQYGITVIPPPDEEALENYYTIGISARKELIGKYYSEDLLEQIESALEEFRSTEPQ